MEIQLERNLRKSIKRGHPWVYKESLVSKQNKKELFSAFAILKDNKGPVTQGIYDSTSPIAFRALDFNPLKDFELRVEIEKAILRRESLKKLSTSGFRLINGEGDGFSGLICDIYSEVAVLQFDGSGMEHFWKKTKVPQLLLQKIESLKTVIYKKKQAH